MNQTPRHVGERSVGWFFSVLFLCAVPANADDADEFRAKRAETF